MSNNVTAITLHQVGKNLFLPTSKMFKSKETVSVELDPIEHRLKALQNTQPKKSYLAMKEMKVDRRLVPNLVKLASKCQSSLLSPEYEDEETIDALFDTEAGDFHSAVLEQGQILQHVEKLLQLCQEWKTLIDFDDMIWLPNALDLRPNRNFDWIFVDEAQDLNQAQISLILRLLKDKPSSRLIAVGDRMQAIYRFRGATHGSMKKLEEQLLTPVTILPLYETVRLPQSHLRLAQQYIPQMKSLKGNEGSWKITNVDCLLHDVAPRDLILCRRNAPMVSLCFDLLEKKKKAHILGETNLKEDLLTVLQKFGLHKSCSEFLVYLDKWCQEESKRIKQRKLWSRQAFVDEYYECLRVLANKRALVREVYDCIQMIFDDEPNTSRANDYIVCSSVHRAKGMESERVWILETEWFYFTSDMNADLYEDKAVLEEEHNLLYVAITRSTDKLFFLGEFNALAWLKLPSDDSTTCATNSNSNTPHKTANNSL
eukprot:TRINITY_DN819_c0_g1_i2.p1 TRINITY_DN819_c0_g1~~TRINITY_DN819_c0_g1_i2.p1  ORF type:complete len:485 (-),score=-8.04 TRINITY_DN819_c0_g1_i2:162-1616(-)